MVPLKEVQILAKTDQDKVIKFKAVARLDSRVEIEYYRNGGILQYMLRQFLKS